MKRIDDFFDFEVKNKLFDIVDEDGHRPWEAIRYYACCNVINPIAISHMPYGGISVFKRAWHFLSMACSFFVYLMSQRNRRIMFLLCSRDKQDGLYYDKISNDLFKLVDKSQTLALDTVWHSSDYKYKGLSSCASSIISLSSYIPHKYCSFSYDSINAKLKDHFPDFNLTVDEMMNYYHEFKVQYYFYKLLFRYSGIKKLFMVQNGIQKGLMAAAHEMGVEVIELQHGQISRNHPAYSYPNCIEVSEEKIYHPAKLLTFGSFWHHGRFYPGVENIVIGNNSYANRAEMPSTAGNKRVLVISNKGDGELLALHVKEILSKDNTFFFFFKLHPNQYEEFGYYKEMFGDSPNVQVYSNELSINQLLAKVDAIFLVQSTAELEALRVGRKVYIIGESNYQVMDFVFGEKGVYLVKDALDFIYCYYKHIDDLISPRDDLFMPFQSDVAKMLLN